MHIEDLIEKKDGTKRMIDECLSVVDKYEGIVAFGAGVGGAALYNLLKERDKLSKLVGWSDNNPMKVGTSYMSEDLIVVQPQEIRLRFHGRIGIIVSSSAYDVIKEQLVHCGVDKNDIYLFNFAFMDLNYTDYEFIMDNIEAFQRAYERMADEKSKKIFTDILNYRITKNVAYLEKMRDLVDDEQYQYFDADIYDFIPNERFLDVGAYTGDTLEVFDRVYSKCDGFQYYYGLEADGKIFTELNKKINALEIAAKSSIYNVAAWDKETTLFFDSVAGSSTMSSNKQDYKNVIRAIRIDDLITDVVTFVKMDIEGAEYNALCGMESLIKNNKPILAICVYHKRDDFYKLTDLIENIVPGEYSFFMRQYRYTPTETVCYMVPRDRVKPGN